MIGLGFALVATICSGAWLQILSERRAMLQSLTQETNNLALIFEQNTERTASEIDRMIRYLRASYNRSQFRADWPTLVQEEFTINRRTVQIAITDAKGMMITSSKMPRPEKPIDLSDREHFRVHAETGGCFDRLFISTPVLGRVTNKWSVQFTRPYCDQYGTFAGVIVVSLDPEFLTRNFSGLHLGTDGGLAIVGDDEIVRAGAGIFETSVGQPLGKGVLDPPVAGNVDHAFTKLTEENSAPSVLVVRKLKDFPLRAVMARSDAPMFNTFLSNRKKYIWGAGILSGAIVLAVFTSIVRRRAYEKHLAYLARHDALTNLLNRREFSDCLDRYFSEGVRKEAPFHVHLVDLDDFKRVNDTYGHPVGDALLVAVGQRLQKQVRDCDVVARLGGDEFAIIQRCTDSTETAPDLADRLCKILSVPYLIEGKRIEISASIGIAPAQLYFENQNLLIRAADLALYACKGAGGHSFKLYDESMNEEALARREIEEGLSNAIALGQLEVHYQPIYDIDGLTMNCVEALVRWRYPEKGMISPGVFIPIAEKSGLIVEIGEWIMERACCEIASRSPTLKVAVNVSAVEFRDGDVPANVRRALSSSGIEPKRLKVEITESTLMSKDRTTLDQLEQIRALGIQISMDDFGTGYSSLSYLQSYTIDYIKIDQSFVRGLGQRKRSTAIVEAIVRLARAMDITTIAEGVETELQLEMLRTIGCEEAQGFLLGRPNLIDEIFPDDRTEVAGQDNSVTNERDASETGAASPPIAPTMPSAEEETELDSQSGKKAPRLRPDRTGNVVACRGIFRSNFYRVQYAGPVRPSMPPLTLSRRFR